MFSVVSRDNGYGKIEATGLATLDAATKVAESHARRCFGSQWEAHRRRDRKLPVWDGLGLAVEVVRGNGRTP
jgi:hypothetical protein